MRFAKTKGIIGMAGNGVKLLILQADNVKTNKNRMLDAHADGQLEFSIAHILLTVSNVTNLEVKKQKP